MNSGMEHYRLTKYDPALRDARGAYAADDWTSIDDVGNTYDEVLLTQRAYERVESAYLDVIRAFVAEAGLDALTITALDIPQDEGSLDPAPLIYHVGDRVGDDLLTALCRGALRGDLWCQLDDPSGFYLHFGYDLYVYLATPVPAPGAHALARSCGLFLEEMRSPYLD